MFNSTDWYSDWQNPTHALLFDGFRLNNRNLIRNYECLNDVRLLNERYKGSEKKRLVEVGCSTGDFYRYLRHRFQRMEYLGLDISQAAIHRAKEKYPQARFLTTRPDTALKETMRLAEVPGKAEIVYSKDVVHHQPAPFEFLRELLLCASQAVIVRLRTRDVGPTEPDPECSCQYHYAGWMPYIVMNLNEVISVIQATVKDSEIVVYRHHMILGGRVNRYLPRECYLKETGTAETAVGVFLKTDRPGTVTLRDREDETPRYTLDYRLRCSVSLALQQMRG